MKDKWRRYRAMTLTEVARAERVAASEHPDGHHVALARLLAAACASAPEPQQPDIFDVDTRQETGS